MKLKRRRKGQEGMGRGSKLIVEAVGSPGRLHF